MSSKALIICTEDVAILIDVESKALREKRRKEKVKTVRPAIEAKHHNSGKVNPIVSLLEKRWQSVSRCVLVV